VEAIADFITQGDGVTMPVFWIMCGVSFIGSLVAAMWGLGGGALVLAVMALYFPPAAMIPLHGVVQFGSNFGRAMIMWREVLWTLVPAFLVGTVLGAMVGANTVMALPTPVLQIVVALFILYAAWAPKFKGGAPSQPKFFAVGALGAFTTMFVGATGPLIAPFVGAATDDRHKVVATHGMLMTFQHGFKCIAFGIVGFAFAPYIALLAGMLAFGFLGTVCGRHVLLRMREDIFRIGFRIVLTALAIRLGYGAIGKLVG
jgi:uncharacterized membrane protein YfcA